MIIEHLAPPAPALSLDALLERQKLSAADVAALRASCTKIAATLKRIDGTRAAAMGQRVPLQDVADRAEQAVIADPTDRAVEALHEAIIRLRDATDTEKRIGQALTLAYRREIDALQPVALRVLDAAAADLEKEGRKRLTEIEKADSVFGHSADGFEFQRRLDRTREGLAAERAAITQGNAALDWLCRRNFTADPFIEPEAFLAAAAEPEDISAELLGDLH